MKSLLVALLLYSQPETVTVRKDYLDRVLWELQALRDEQRAQRFQIDQLEHQLKVERQRCSEARR